MLLLKTRKAEGVASVVGGVAVACVRAAAAVAGAVGYAAPLLRRLATRLQEAVSRRLPPPPLPARTWAGAAVQAQQSDGAASPPVGGDG